MYELGCDPLVIDSAKLMIASTTLINFEDLNAIDLILMMLNLTFAYH